MISKRGLKSEVRKCSAGSCTKMVGLTMLMCNAHWKIVPKDLQLEVLRTCRAHNRAKDKPTQLKYYSCARRAIRVVTEAEA